MLDFADTLFDTISDKTKKGPWYTRSLWWIALVGVGVLVLSGWALRHIFVNRRLAAALHERDVAKEDLHKGKLEQKLGDLEETKKIALETAAVLEKNAAIKEKEVDSLKEEAKVSQEVIESLESWDDVKKRIKF
jgi:hypothetical protein